MCCRDNAIYDFSKKAVENGLDIFRVFDSLNYFGELLFCLSEFFFSDQ
jgi:pyruvate carboxylase